MEPFERLLVAALIGFLIGLDRERAEVRKRRPLFAGVRTFPLIALAGAVPMLLIDRTGPWLLVASFAGVAAVAVVSYFRSTATGKIGATTEITALATFLLGTMAGAGELIAAGAAGVGVAVLLVAKPPLERFSRALSPEELSAALELAVVSVIILPLVPNRSYGPWHVLNPFEIWAVVVLVSALSFAGFVAIRLLGERGVTISGVLGALVSSTAVTVAMATLSGSAKHLAAAAASAAVLASAVMCVRVAVFTAAVAVGILPRLLPVVAAMGLVGTLGAWLVARRQTGRRSGSHRAALSNPFSLIPALTFGAIYAVVLVVVHAANEYLGAAGMYGAAALAALADVDAVAIALAHQGAATGAWQAPALAVSIAMVTNTLVKLGIAVVMGTGVFRRYVAVTLTVMAVVGVAVAVLVARWS